MKPKYHACKTCNLCAFLNFSRPFVSEVMCVGLSAKANTIEPALCETTNSGNIIAQIESKCRGLSFYKTNLVKGVPTGSNGKIRYPTKMEMSLCYPNLIGEIEVVSPRVVLLLGEKVSNFILSELSISKKSGGDIFSYYPHEFGGVKYIPIHHPSYIRVYKYSRIEEYVKAVSSIVMEQLAAHVPAIKKRRLPRHTTSCNARLSSSALV